jgi:hypothetical protein
MKVSNTKENAKLINELFGDTTLLSPLQQPSIEMESLELLGIMPKTHNFKNSTAKVVSEAAQRKLAIVQIYIKLNEAIKLADTYQFENISKKLTEIKTKISKKVKE